MSDDMGGISDLAFSMGKVMGLLCRHDTCAVLIQRGVTQTQLDDAKVLLSRIASIAFTRQE